MVSGGSEEGSASEEGNDTGTEYSGTEADDILDSTEEELSENEEIDLVSEDSYYSEEDESD